MKKLFAAVLIAAIAVTSLTFLVQPQSARENNDVSSLALMLPESDVILAVDMNKTLNVVGPSLMNQDGKKIENLKKLMKSLENMIGVNPYEINQVVAGIKLPSSEEKDILGNLDYTVILRTAHSNNVLLEDWSKKIDAIEAFNVEKQPTEKYFTAFKLFRYHKLGKEETEKITKLNKEFDEILKKTNDINGLLKQVPKSARSVKLYKDSVKKNKILIDAISRYQTLLKQDSDIKSLHDSAIKLQNRWYEINLDDPKRGEKLTVILKEAKAFYPNYRAKTANVAKIETLLNLSDREFYEKLSKKNFGLLTYDEKQTPNDMMKEKLNEILDTLDNFSTAKPNIGLKLVSNNLQRLEDTMSIRLKVLDEMFPLTEVYEDDTIPAAPTRSLSKTIKENAKISEVNGKRLITIDYDKIDFWNPDFEDENTEVVKSSETKIKDTKNEIKTFPNSNANTEVKIAPNANINANINANTIGIVKDKDEKKDKKKEMFAIGYFDETTMVVGFESGIRTMLNRKTDYKNPKAAEMLNSFKNPLIAFATNTKVFENLAKTVVGTEKDKKETPVDKFFKDINIFGSVEYDADSEATNDLIMSLGFTKNKVEAIFKDDKDEAESTIFELGEYEFGKEIFYDLLNTLKAYKASMSFKFEKKKLAALVESAPQIIQDARLQNGRDKTVEKVEKVKVQSLQNIGELLISPNFYTNLFETITKKGKK
jgi:hypothetical protein